MEIVLIWHFWLSFCAFIYRENEKRNGMRSKGSYKLLHSVSLLPLMWWVFLLDHGGPPSSARRTRSLIRSIVVHSIVLLNLFLEYLFDLFGLTKRKEDLEYLSNDILDILITEAPSNYWTISQENSGGSSKPSWSSTETIWCINSAPDFFSPLISIVAIHLCPNCVKFMLTSSQIKGFLFSDKSPSPRRYWIW